MAKVGRPSSYTPEIAAEICNRMVEGEDLVTICKSPGMPHRMTVLRWQDAHPDFAAEYARAREALADFDANRIMQIAMESSPETANADRVKIAAFQWLAAKRAPKRWGDKVEVEAKVEVSNAPTENLMAFLAAAEKAKKGG